MAIKSVFIMGAGVMGSGIAQLAATHGCNVRLMDIDHPTAVKSIETVNSRIQPGGGEMMLQAAVRLLEELAHDVKPASSR